MAVKVAQTQGLYEFGPFRLDAAERQLWRGGEAQSLPPKAFEMLLALVERSGRLVEKEELARAVWPDLKIVEEGNINHHIWVLRRTLGASGEQYIETVPKHGYRFTAAVKRLPDAGVALVVEKHTRTRLVAEVETSHEDEAVLTGTAPAPLVAHSEKQSWRGRRVALAVGTMCLLVAGAVVFVYPRWAARQPETRAAVVAGRPLPRSIAVLPFKTIGAETESEYLGIGMSDALITRLGNSRQLVVRPTSAIRRYTDPNQDPVAIGRQQGVEAVLDGSLQRAGDRIRATVQLINVGDGAALWTAQFDERFTDIFAVQDSISQRVMRELVVELNAEEKAREGRRGQRNAEAYQEYLKGRYFWNKRTSEGYQKAVEHFNRAIELDPSDAQAYSGLADALFFLSGSGKSLQEFREGLAKARAASMKAIEIDETLAEPHATLGLLAMNEWDWTGAEREFKRAIELNPNYATAHHWYGEFLAYMGRFDEGLAEVKRAQELDPLSLIISTDVGKVYYLARQYDRTIEQCRKTLEMDQSYSMAHAWLGFAYSAQGQHEKAIAEFQQIAGLQDDSVWLSYLGYAYGVAGRRGEAQQALTRLIALSKRTYVAPIVMVIVHLGLGDKDGVFKWYERVFEERSSGAIELKINPALDSLRSDPRYADLLRRAGFAP